MARPKNHPDELSGATERETAPVQTVPAYVPPAPRQMSVERTGGSNSPVSRRFPQVRGGVCEFCGVLDPNTPSQFQYRLCPHYRGLHLACSYCPSNLNPDEVVKSETLNVAEHPFQRGVLIAWCGKYECSKAHMERFQLARA